MKTYTCIRCGKRFEAKVKTAVCKDCHTAVCVVCGKIFDLKSPWTQKTCSSKCRGEYRKMSGISKHVAEKAKSTRLKRYGVENLSDVPREFKKICKYCGKEFRTDSSRREYCYDTHYGSCPVCGKQVEINEMHLGPQACSEECRKKRIQSTSLERYGATNIFASDYGKNVIKKTLQTKYGVDHYSKTDEFRDKFTSTMMDRYGTTIPRKNADINKKAMDTCIDRYGGESPTCDASIAEKARETVEQNFGGFGMASPELSKRIRETNLKKYGVEIPTQSEEIQSKIRTTNLQRYGAENFNQSIYGVRKSISDPDKADKFMKFKQNPAKYIHDNYDDVKVPVTKLSEDLGVTDTPIYDILIANGCRDLASVKLSYVEDEISTFIKSLLPGIKIIHNDGSVLSPMEIDLYVPDKHFGIECNPTITHNSSVRDPWGNDPKPYSYHKHKSICARDSGVFLFHVFGYEWTHHREIIESMIENILGCTEYKLYARNTYVCQISNDDCLRFLEDNHRQGGTYASVRLGLRDSKSNELVSVMTFNRMRSTIGKTSNDTNAWELSRFCSKLHTSVIGGASKLFKYFVDNFDYSNIVSFSDIAHTRGSLYRTLGFEPVNESNPSYVWVDYMTDIALHRVQCRKSNMHRLFPNESIDLSKTERQIMEEHGYVRVYDSGTIRWEYKKKSG